MSIEQKKLVHFVAVGEHCLVSRQRHIMKENQSSRTDSPGAGPGPASSAASEHLALLDELQPPAVQFGVVQLLQGVLHASTLRKLDKTFALPLVVSVGVGDLTSGAEVVLQVLPRCPGGEVLDDDAVHSLWSIRDA